jgi:glycine C-acetyltransferase/8-amino-7-oxononanoate synthase
MSDRLSDIALVRSGYLMESAPDTETVINGKRYLYFGGTGYHTLQNHPVLMKAACEALSKYGLHSATSRNILGTTPLYVAVEEKAAEFFGTEDAAYVSSGYLSNMAAFQALRATAKLDVVFVDAGSHYSIMDFLELLHLPMVTFAHGEPEDLRMKLREHLKPKQKPLVVSDAIFPLMGQLAPVAAYVEVLEPYEATMWLDDSHGVGVLGANGRGSYEHYGLKSDRLLFGGTFSKAFGSHGGVVPGRKSFVEAIRNGHVMNGATPPTSPAAATALASMEFLMQHPELRTKLRANARLLKTGLRALGFAMDDSPLPIAAWTLKSGEEMDRVHEELLNRGICIQRAHYVGASAEGVLRAVVFSSHTTEQINRLLGELKQLL